MDVGPLSEMLVEGNDFLLLTHVNPDGDAIGTTLGLAHILKDNGKRVTAYLHSTLPEAYETFAGNIQTIIGDLPPLHSFATIVCLDFSSPNRFGDLPFHELPSINIDHHVDNQNFCKDNFVFPAAAATAEIIFHAARGVRHWRISPNAATLLLLGLIMDTGRFQFHNTTPAALRAAAELIELGANHAEIITAMFLSKPLNMAKMEAEIICDHLKTAHNGRFAWFHLQDDTISQFKVNPNETEHLIDRIREIKGFEIVAIIRDTEEKGKFRVSLRSRNPNTPVGPVARRLGGGGHDLAAGCSINAETIETAEQKLLAEIAQALEG